MPQELTTDAFETRLGHGQLQPRPVRQAAPNPAHIEKVLRDLSLWDKKDSKIMTLSGGMKRRVMIAKALSRTSRASCSSTSRPPASTSSCAATCGRWSAALRDGGVTIILTTHYIEEAEEMADRIGVISKGEIILVEDKAALMQKLGKKQLTAAPAAARSPAMPDGAWPAIRSSCRPDGSAADLHLRRARPSGPGSPACCESWASSASTSRICRPAQSSLEDIFVSLVQARS